MPPLCGGIFGGISFGGTDLYRPRGDAPMLTAAQIKRLPIPPKTQKRPDTYTDYDALQLHVFNTGRRTRVYAFRWPSPLCQ